MPQFLYIKKPNCLRTYLRDVYYSRGVTKYKILLVIDWKVVFLNFMNICFYKLSIKGCYRPFGKFANHFKISNDAWNKKDEPEDDYMVHFFFTKKINIWPEKWKKNAKCYIFINNVKIGSYSYFFWGQT